MPIIRMPDGVDVEFPDSMPQEQVKSLILSKFPDIQPQAAPEPQKDPGFISNIVNLAKSGYESSAEGVKAQIGGDESLPGLIAQRNTRTANEYQPPQLQEAKYAFKDEAATLDEGGAWNTTKGIAGIVAEIGKQVLTNPKGVAYLGAEQAANMAAIIAGRYPGAAAGGMAGGATPFPGGAAVGAFVGGAATGGVAEYALEAGSATMEGVTKRAQAAGVDVKDENALREFIQSNPQALEESKIEGAKKGFWTALVDQAMMGVSGRIASAPARAAQKEAAAQIVGTNVSLLADKAIAKTVADKADEILKATSLASRAKQLGLATGNEMIGGMGSEAAGQYAAYDNLDWNEIALEGLGEVVTGPVEAMAVGREYMRDTRTLRNIPQQSDPADTATKILSTPETGDIGLDVDATISAAQSEIDSFGSELLDEAPPANPPGGGISFDERPAEEIISNAWRAAVQPDTTTGLINTPQEASNVIQAPAENHQPDLRNQVQAGVDVPATTGTGEAVMPGSVRAAAVGDGVATGAAQRLGDAAGADAQLSGRAGGETVGNSSIVQSLQNRNRNSKASVLQMNAIAKNPNPRLMMASPTMENGAPIVTDLHNKGIAAHLGNEDVVVTGKREIPFRYAVVEAGQLSPSNFADGTKNTEYAVNPDKLTAINNGRTAGIMEAYRLGTAGNYKQVLVNNAAAYGLNPDQVQSMVSPVMVRMIDAAHVTESIGDESNTTGTLGLSAVEQARNDAGRVDIFSLTFNDNGTPTNEAMRGFIHAMPEGERQNLAPNGTPTKQAVDRVLGASLWQAYGSEELVELAVQSTEPEARTVIAALSNAAPAMMKLEGAGDLDIRPLIVEAATAVVNAGRQGVSVTKLANQKDLAHSNGVQVVLDMFARNVRSVKRITEILNDAATIAADGAAHAKAGDMFGGASVTREDVLRRFGHDTTGTQDLGQPSRGVAPGQDAQQRAAERTGSADNRPAQAVRTADQGISGAQQSEGLDWWNGLDGAQRNAAIAAAGLNIKAAGWQFISKTNRAKILAAREEPLLTSYTQADIAAREQAAADTTSEDRAAEARAVEHLRNQPPSLSVQTQERSEGATSQSGMFTADGRATVAAELSGKAKAQADMDAALAEAGALLRNSGLTLSFIPESEKPKWMPVLVKMFDAAFRLGYYEIKDATEHVRGQLKKLNKQLSAFMRKSWMDEAAKEAASKMPDGFFENQGLFGQAAPKQEAQTTPEEINYDTPEDIASHKGNYKPAPIEQYLAQEIIDRADKAIKEYGEEVPEVTITDEERAKALPLVEAMLEKARAKEGEYTSKIDAITKRSGAIGRIIGKLKKADRAAIKLVKEYIYDTAGLKDLLRSTIVVERYEDVARVLDEIRAEFTVTRVKNRTGIELPGLETLDRKKTGGYADLLVNVRLDNGLEAEIQVNVPAMLAAKDSKGHELYDALRVKEEGSTVKKALEGLMMEFYDAAYAAASNSPAASMRKAFSEDGMLRDSVAPTLRIPPATAMNEEPSGKLTYSSPPNEASKPQPSGNLSGTGITPDLFISGSSNHTIAKNASDVHNGDLFGGENTTQGAQHENQSTGTGGNEREGSATAGRTAGKRKSGSVHQRESGNDLFANQLPGGADSQASRDGQGRGDAKDGDLQQRAVPRTGDRAGRATGIPAGRDIPAKTGRNYRLTDDDLNYQGSWLTKAEQNVEAVELVKRLEAEKRDATREEQAVLAKFIGWGASEIRNNIFDARLDKQIELVSLYDKAIAEMEQKGRDYLQRGERWGGGDSQYYAAFQVLHAKDASLNYYSITKITKDQLQKAKPDMNARKWVSLRDRLQAVMSEDEWATAARSTQYAHYTGKEVVDELWRAVGNMGFKGGLVLEPGAGNGVFPGRIPAEMGANSSYTGIEFDGLTGAILKHLQPDERILVESYIDTQLPDNFYDVAIGNPPFSATRIVSDPRYKKHAFALHDYFFAKTIDKVKPGGLMVFVTSRYTMDKQGDKARNYLAERADLLGAIRLPETAFKKNAGTEVVTDILFLRKKVPGEVFEGYKWGGLEKVKVKGGEHLINEYFAAHPEMVLGEGAIDRNGMYAKDQYTVLPNKDIPIAELLAKAIDKLPKDAYRPEVNTAAHDAVVREFDWNPKAKKEGSYYVADDGQIMQVESRVGVPAKIPAKDQQIIINFIRLRDAVNQAQYDQLNNGDWEKSLEALRKEYARFVEKHGRIMQNTIIERKQKVEDEDGQIIDETTETRRFGLLGKIDDDPEYTKLLALEKLNDETGEITDGDFLKGRVLDARKTATIATPADALLSVLNDTGKVNMPEIAKRIGLTEAEVIEALGAAVYESPSHGWQMADEYLSGNVKQKLKEAEAAAKTDKRYARNVEALLAVQPRDLTPADITASLGMNWIPSQVYERFLMETAGVGADVIYNEALGSYQVKSKSGYDSNRATIDWGISKRFHAGDVMEHGLTGRPIRINKKVGSGSDAKTVFDADATEAANQKLKALREEFSSWLWRDEERTAKLLKLYNEKFNNIVPRSFDGRHLTLPGTTSTISVFDHVKRGAWRVIQTGNTYLAHAVGSGKTWQMVISAMEQKRLGMINKPMMVVPNHMLQQFAQEWLQLYPAGRLLVADEKQFAKENRRRFVARAAMSDLDGIIITQSAFKLIDIDPEFKEKMIREEIEQMEAARDNALEEDGEDDPKKSRNPLVRDIQKRIENLEEQLKAASSSAGKDQNIRFDEMGVDMLYVDEAHLYRKLSYSTARQVKGISPAGSQYARDLYIKSRWLEEKHPGRSLVMASGTPITNTMAEMYSVQRFMQPKVLEERGLMDFDAWASTFGQEKTDIESDVSGNYSPVTRFSRFINVPELTQMFREFADVLTSDHLAKLLGDERPKVKYGTRKLVVTPQVDDYLEYKKELAERVKKSKEWKPSKDEPNNPDPMIRIIGDGRLAAIDMRFIDPSLPSNPNSKLNVMIDNVIRSYKKYEHFEYREKSSEKDADGNKIPGKLEDRRGATQMVFSDIGFGEGVAENRGFDARAWMEKRLQAAGIPKSQYAFMSDYKKSDAKRQLFKDVNSGKVRILIGSSKNMGTGVNAQQRLRALHHLDTPWFPADLEQREGRIIRQGNKNRNVRIFAYSTKDSYDRNMWQMLASKQQFIDQALSGDSSVRTLEDISEAGQYAMAMAMTAGDERIIRLAGMKADMEKYNRLHRAHEDSKQRIRQQFSMAGMVIESNERLLPDAEKLAAKVKDLSGDNFAAKVGKAQYDKRKDFGAALLAKLKHYTDVGKEGSEQVGEISGFPITLSGRIERDNNGKVLRYDAELTLSVGEEKYVIARDPNDSDVGLAMRATNALAEIARKPDAMRQKIADAKSQRNALESRLDSPFQFEKEMADTRAEIDKLEAELVAESAGKAVSELESKAKAFAEKYHGEIDQRRKFTNELYIMHPQGVVDILRTVPHTKEMLAAAWAHDTVEDTKATIEDVRAELGDKVAGLVGELTSQNNGGTRAERDAAKLTRLSTLSAEAQTIKLADIIHNLSGLAQADEQFASRYLVEKMAQVEALTKGDAKLLEMARDAVKGNGLAIHEPPVQYALYETEEPQNLPEKRGSDRIREMSAKARVIRAAKAVSLQEVGAAAGLYYVTAKLESVGRRELPAKIITTRDAANATQYLSRFAVEHFDAIVTDKAGRPLAVIGSFKGAATQTSVYPATIAMELSKIKGAANLWASHNHPSGKAELSAADRQLSSTIREMLRGSGVEYRGLMAISSSQFASDTNDNGEIERAPVKMVSVPVVERVMSGEPQNELTINSPKQAKIIVSRIAQDKPGILFLSAQHAPVAFVPFDPLEMGELRVDGRLMKLFNAAASTGASAAIIANPDGKIQLNGMAGDIPSNNLASALKQIDIDTLDVITYNSTDPTSGAKSASESGRLILGSTFKSQSAATVREPFTLPGLKSAINAAFTHVKDFAGLLEATGKVKFISRSEIGKYLGDGATFSKSQDKSTQTKTEAFKRWFGDSKVVDKQGKPLVVYHGTASDFSRFSTEEAANTPESAGEGAFFFGTRDIANGFAREAGVSAVSNGMYAGFGPHRVSEGDNVMPVYLALNNPKVMQPKDVMDIRGDFDELHHSPRKMRKAIAEAKKQGFDGLLLKNYPEELEEEIIASDQWVAFYPEQIKSAIGNNGEFNPNNPDIRYSADGSRILAFVRDGITHFVYDNISQTDDNVKGLAMHEVALHALQLGKSDAEFQRILKHIETLRTMGNKKVQAARDRVPADTDPDLVLEEQAGYLIEQSSDMPIVQKLIARFRALLRSIGKALPVMQRMQWFRWADNLTVDDIVLMAQDAMRAALRGEGLAGFGGRGALLQSGVAFGNNASPIIYSKRQQSIPGTAQPPAQPPRQGNIQLQGGQPGNRASWDAPEPSMFDDLVYKLQDKNIDLKRVIEAIRSTGAKIAEKWNAYLQEELFHGRAAKRVQDFVNTELKPLITEMKMRGQTLEELDQYLHARHAKEANALIASRDPNMPDGGSGMTNQEADDYFANLPADKRKRLEATAKRVDAIIAKTREYYVAYGLVSRDQADSWAQMFQHYVPLMREDHDGYMGIGQGFSIKGKEVKHRTGSTAKVVDIFANIAMQREKAIVRGEKNRVAVALAGLAKINPNPDFWSFNKPPTERVLNEKTGLVEERIDPTFRSKPNVVVAKIKDGNGQIHERAVIFNEHDERAVRMAEAMKNLDATQLGGVLGVSAVITRYFASINTQYNPIFGVTNLVRDVQGAALNLTSTKLAGKQKEVLSHILSAAKGIYLDARAERKGHPATSKWAALWEELQDQGGMTGYRDLYRNSADRAKAIEHELDPHNWVNSKWGKVFTANGALKVPITKAQDIASPIFEWLSDYNLMMEGATRLSIYKTALDNGLTKQEAASLAKNTTVNFNRKGQSGQHAGAMYAFFNAAMQGSARIGQTMFDMDKGDIKTMRLSKTGKAIVTGGVMLGVMQTLALAMAGFDDDEPPEFIRERNLVIPIGGKRYITIPMPLGFHAIPNIGRISTEFALGGFRNPTEHVMRLAGVFSEAFNPIGSAGLSMQTIAPTALDPFAALAENKDWTGKTIYKEDFSSLDPTPGFTRNKDTASFIAKFLAEGVNYATGGNDYRPGAVSPTADQIEYLWGQVTGGVGREASKFMQAGQAAVTGEELPTHKIPLAGRFYGNLDDSSSQGGKYYANLKEINMVDAELTGRRKDGLPIDEFKRENPEYRLILMAKTTDKIIRNLRKRKAELVKRDADSEEIRAIDDRITMQMRRLNDRMKEVRAAN